MALVRITLLKPALYQGVWYNTGDVVDFVDDAQTLGRWVMAGICTQGFTARESDNHKYDVGMVPTSLASTNLTGRYYSMVGVDRAVFICQYGPVVTTGTVQMEILQATDVIGTGAATITKGTVITNATEITHVAAVKVITLATLAAGTTVTITVYKKNATTAAKNYPMIFTSQAGATNVALRQFQVVGVDATDAAQLVVCLNDPTYGTPEIFWVAAAGAVTGQAIDDSTTFTITCSVDDATDVRTQPQGQIIIGIDRNAMAAGSNWLAAKVTTTATIVCGVTLLRMGSRFLPNAQQTDIVRQSIVN